MDAVQGKPVWNGQILWLSWDTFDSEVFSAQPGNLNLVTQVHSVWQEMSKTNMVEDVVVEVKVEALPRALMQELETCY